uniref:DUF4371 domain-containing protein n=1 Tax=Arundo donax TaxID=35708 RepID=A0A0A8Y3A4_ARUDO
MVFLDNGSGRSLNQRMLVDMAGYLVNQMLEDPAIRQHNGPRRMRIVTPTLENDIAHAFAKEIRKRIANEIHGDFFGIFVDVCSTCITCKSYMVLFARYLDGARARLRKEFLGLCHILLYVI